VIEPDEDFCGMPCGQVYADFVQHCPATRLPQPWGRFAEPGDLAATPQDEETLVAALCKNHSIAALLRSGVVCQGENKKLILPTAFIQPYCSLLPLRHAPHDNPFDLLTDDGTTSGRLPLAAAIQDHRVAAGIAERGLLCIAFSLPDMVSLRAVGVPAALAMGLDEITCKSLQELRSALGPPGAGHAAPAGHSDIQPPSAAAAEAGGIQETHAAGSSSSSPAAANSGPGMIDPPQLIFVGWSPARLSSERPASLDRVLREIQGIAGCLGIDLAEVSVWRPTVAEIQQITFALSKGVQHDVVQAILKSIDQSAQPVIPSARDQGTPGDFLQARARLHEALARPRSGPNYRRRRLQAYQKAVDKNFVEPLLLRAAEESNPQEGSRLAVLAEINRLLYPSLALYAARLEREIIRTGPSGKEDSLQNKDVMKLFELVYRFTKERRR